MRQLRGIALALACALSACSGGGEKTSCSLEYDLPGDIPQALAEASQSDFEQYSWQTFLALNAPEVGGQISLTGDNPTQWSRWSSSTDLIECNLDPEGCLCPDGDCARSGSRSYPPECRAIPGFESFRALDNIQKADDGFLEAKTGGLSNSPVLDSQGGFLRYEILVSPATYEYVSRNRYYDWPTLEALDTGISFPCGRASYQGGDPADPEMGGLVLKLAWMDGALPGERYHTEDLLVYTPAYRSSTGVASCERRTMSLVGMHVVHKTVKQPNWTWATFEHARNAPDCSGLPPSGQQQPRVNTACPSSLDGDYNLASADCAGGACASCNIPPASNAASGQCVDPTSESDPGWCLDLPPAANGGLSLLCRQVSVAEYYPDSEVWNRACAGAIGEASVWSRYQLIATQRFAFETEPTECESVQASFASSASRESILPQIPISADPGGAGQDVPSRPWLGNSSMESYERSNCTGCHSQGAIKTSDGASVTNDFIYFLTVETCAAWCDENGLDSCPCLGG